MTYSYRLCLLVSLRRRDGLDQDGSDQTGARGQRGDQADGGQNVQEER